MNFTVSRNELTAALKVANKVISNSLIAPILNNFLFNIAAEYTHYVINNKSGCDLQKIRNSILDLLRGDDAGIAKITITKQPALF